MGKDTDYLKKLNSAVLSKECENGKTVQENINKIISLGKKIDELNSDNVKYQIDNKSRRKEFRILKDEVNHSYRAIKKRVRAEYEEQQGVKQDGRYKIAQIIRRKCSEKLQPSVRVGQRYFIVGRDKTKSGADVIVLADISRPTRGENLVTIRCNSDRFEWKEFTQAELVEQGSLSAVPEQHCDIVSPEEAQMRVMQKIAHETKVLTTSLTSQEQLRVSFIPLVINNLAWMYAEKARQCAARDRISFLRDQSRELKKIADEYDRDQREILDSKHVYKAVQQTKMCAEEMQMDLTLLYYSVNSEFKKEVPDYPYDEMRSYAIISVLFIRFLEEWNREMDEFLRKKFRDENFRETVVPPSSYRMLKVMKAFAGVEGFDYCELNISNGMKAIKNRIRNIEFSIV